MDKGDGFSFVRRGQVGAGKQDLAAAALAAIEQAADPLETHNPQPAP